jgi:probable HAF family extracellular repeat protein
MKLRFVLAVALVAALAIPSLLAAQSDQILHPSLRPVTLKFRTIDIPSDESTQIYAVNNNNQGAGIYIDSTGLQHGMLIQRNQVTMLDDPQATPGTTFCFGINDSGVVVGYYTNVGGFEVGFEYQDGTFTDVRPFVSPYVQIYGINNAGVITGTYYDAVAKFWNAFYGSGTSFTSFTVPGGGYYVYGSAINNAGLIVVGYFVDANSRVYMADLYNPTTGVFTPINVPGAAQTYVNGINDKNHIVYTWEDASGKHGEVLANGTFYEFDDPDGTDTAGDGINDNDIIVGTFLPTGDTQRQSFVATPQP